MEENKKMKKSEKYLIIGILVLFLSIIGVSIAYYLARVQGTLSGRAAGTELELTITKLSTSASMDLIPLDNDLETLGLAALGYGNNSEEFDATKACIDINGYSVCQIYRVRVTNNGTVPLTMNGTVELSGQNVPNIDCAKMDDEVTITSNASCMGTNVLASSVTLPANNHLDYYIMIYINNLDEPQYDSGAFNGTVIFTTEDGKKVKGRFTKPFNLAEHITNLYNNGNKSVVTANLALECLSYNSSGSCIGYDSVAKTIDYNYVPSSSLMNDRLGGTTESLDGGNIRYYGASPNNYVDIGDRTANDEVILWRIIGVFDGKVRIITNESIGYYSLDTSADTVNSGHGINEWSQADLMKLLNPEYDNNPDLDSEGNTIIVNNSLWWNNESGTCYNGGNNATTSCDFTSSGLSNEAKEYVVDQTLYLGGFDTENVSANQAYVMERETNVWDGSKISNCSNVDWCNDTVERTTSWTGKVGIPYPSDYGYAVDLSRCSGSMMNYASNICRSNTWMYTGNWWWTISPRVTGAYTGAFIMRYFSNSGVSNDQGVWPVLTLDSIALAESGNGTQEHPYVLTG